MKKLLTKLPEWTIKSGLYSQMIEDMNLNSENSDQNLEIDIPERFLPENLNYENIETVEQFQKVKNIFDYWLKDLKYIKLSQKFFEIPFFDTISYDSSSHQVCGYNQEMKNKYFEVIQCVSYLNNYDTEIYNMTEKYNFYRTLITKSNQFLYNLVNDFANFCMNGNYLIISYDTSCYHVYNPTEKFITLDDFKKRLIHACLKYDKIPNLFKDLKRIKFLKDDKAIGYFEVGDDEDEKEYFEIRYSIMEELFSIILSTNIFCKNENDDMLFEGVTNIIWAHSEYINLMF